MKCEQTLKTQIVKKMLTLDNPVNSKWGVRDILLRHVNLTIEG